MKYLFYIAKLYSLPIIQPLCEYLDHQTEDSYILFVSEKVKKKILDTDYWKNKSIITHISEGIKYNPDFCLTPGNYIDFRLPGIKVEIFHGIGIEKNSHYQIRHFFDVYMTSGPIVTQKFQELQNKYRYFLVKETGWAKMDYIMKFNTSNIKERYHITQGKKIILYAPTFSNKLQSADALLPVIPDIIQENELWLVKFHEIKDTQFIHQIQGKKPDQIRIISDNDITPYLHIADLMISDTSSVIYEFMALDKPVITYKTSKRKDKGIDIQSPDQLRPAIDRVLNNPSEHHEQRLRHLKEVNPYLNGEISNNIFIALKQIIINNELKGKKKPLNLFRKMRILFHETFRKGYLK